ncbi:ankyrin repeat-containing domain protein [Aspergillus filifer]
MKLATNLQNHAQQSALWCAANLGYAGVVKQLLEMENIQIECRDETGSSGSSFASIRSSQRSTPLATAVVEEHPEIVKLLLAKGANINAQDNLYQLSPIFWAINFSNEDIANVLIDEKSIDLASPDRYGRTRLYCAMERCLPLVGLRGVALFLVLTHLARAWDVDLFSPRDTEDAAPRFLQLPVFRISWQGRLGVTIFAFLTGYVCALKPVKLSRNGNMLGAFTAVGKSAFRRPPRLILPATLALIISWAMAQCGAFIAASRSD